MKMAMTLFHLCLILKLKVLLVLGDTCYKTLGSYVYSTYCSGYCSGSYGSETCKYYYTYTYYYYYYAYVYDALSTGAIAGIVIGCLFALGITIAIIVVIVKSCTKSSGSHGRVVQPNTTTTVAYTGTATTLGQQNYDGTFGHPCQPPNYGQSYPPSQPAYPTISTQNPPQQPPPYGITPVDSKQVHI